MMSARTTCSLSAAILLMACTTSAGATSATDAISGIWACSMEREYDGSRTLMVGHTFYGPSGEYEATGLGTVILDHEADQIRWVATSSGHYQIDDDQIEYEVDRVTASPLPSIGFEFMSEEERAKFTSDFVMPINDENLTSKSRIRSLSTREFAIEEENGALWNCSKAIEISR